MPLILSPKLQSRLLKRQNERVHFFVWTDISPLPSIELWSNLHQHKTWHATSFHHVTDGWYQLILPLQQPCDTYEYTLRYWQNGQQVWLGSCFENGIISILALVDPLPPLDLFGNDFLTLMHSDQRTSWIYKVKKRTGRHRISLLTVNRLHSYMALARKSSCWLVPVSGMTLFEHDTRPWQLLIYRDALDGSTTVWMVRTCKNQDGWLHINTTAVLELHTEAENDQDSDNTMYLVGGMTYGIGDNAIKTLLSTLMAPFMKQPHPTVMDHYLGYCTWNSLGQDITITGIQKVLNSFEKYHIPIGYLIMDDGWQEQQDGYLIGFDADLSKFPDGLCGTIQSLKQRYPSLRLIGVWTTLWGYWRGVDVASIGKLYSPTRSYSTLGDTKTYQILFDRVEQFYDDYYRYLAEAGVDTVKIDYQGGIDDLQLNDNGTLVPLSLKTRHQLWDRYRNAAAHALEKYMASPPLHCMALNPHLLNSCTLATEKNTKTWFGGTIRNSDDFFPNVHDSHPWHIYVNLLNCIWSSSFFSAIDFDMFQSAHPFGEYHAASRAISGGPVYITDMTDHHDVDLIRTLTAENREGMYQILRCAQSCWPTFDTVLGGKPMTDQDFIGAWNSNGTAGFVYGYWSMQTGNQCIVTTPIPSGYAGYVTLGLDTGKWLYNMESKDDLLLASRLAGGRCSLVRVVPVYLCQPSSRHVTTATFTCLGLLDKLNGLQPIIYAEKDSPSPLGLERHIEHDKTHHFSIHLSHRSSQCGFLLSWSTTGTTGTATILWAKMDGVDVTLEKKKQTTGTSTHGIQQDELWILDMTQVSLAASNTCYFSIDICISL